MLGFTPVVGELLGLPLDIRHVAFASANLACGSNGLDYAVPIGAAAVGALGELLIGLTNLAASFGLALRVALRSCGISDEPTRGARQAGAAEVSRPAAGFLLAAGGRSGVLRLRGELPPVAARSVFSTISPRASCPATERLQHDPSIGPPVAAPGFEGRHRGARGVSSSPSEALFQVDAYQRSCDATVVDVSDASVILDRTVFYPTGGGQPGDTGTLRAPDGREWRVVDTRKGEGGRIVHALESGATLPVPGTTVEATIDWQRRHAHMRMHTCLHLLGSVLRYGVTGGQIAADKGRLDFDTQEEIDRDAVTAAVNALVAADHRVRSTWITDEDLDRQPELVRTLSVQPPRGAGRIRLLEIPGVDLQPCGGTHVAATGEIGPVVVTKVESKGRRNRRVYIGFA